MEKLKFEIVEEIELSKEAFDLLKKIDEAGQAVYRDHHYETTDDYLDWLELNDTQYNELEKERFLRRNFGGTFYLTGELLMYNLIEDLEGSWHLTYIISEKGKKFLEKYKNFLE